MAQELIARLPATLELALWGMMFAALFGRPTGILAGVRADKPADPLMRVLHIGSLALPIFWVGLMFQVIFAVKLGWLPVANRLSGRLAFAFQRVTGFHLRDALILGDKEILEDVVKHLVLPAIILGLAQMGFLGRVTRAALLRVLDTEYVTTARAKGLRERQVILGHALRNALIPTITVFGLQFSMLMGGAVLTENVFSWPGIAGFLVQSPCYRDWWALQGTIAFIGVVVTTMNLVGDLFYSVIDPEEPEPAGGARPNRLHPVPIV